MKNDEMKVISDIAAKRDKGEASILKQGLFKCVSPSNKLHFIGWAVFVGILFVGILIVSSRASHTQVKQSPNDRLISRLMPRDEVTPEYIESLGATNDKREIENTDKKETPQEEIKPVPSMMLYTSDGASNHMGALGIPMGAELSAVLENDIIADDRSIPIIARVTKEFRKDGKNIVPRNARLFGSSQGMIEDRINVKFTKIVFPDGKEYPFSGIATDSNGTGGVAGKLNRKRGKRGASILSNALIGASSVFAPGGAGFADSALRGAHRGASSELLNDSSYYRRTQATPVVTIRSNTNITVLVDRAV